MKAMKNTDDNETKDMLSKVNVIEKKSDMIDQLIGNMFHATLEELENLKVEPEEEPSTLIADMLNELRYYETIRIKNSIPECLVYMDVLRLKQVIDNIINNSYKYAKTQIDVSFKDLIEGIIVEIRDYGDGVEDEELPLITEKFFRGKNGKGKSGTGLGLFLANYFMNNMNGAFECFNDNGFVVNLFLRKV
jgi:signal transduction histidine kinase